MFGRRDNREHFEQELTRLRETHRETEVELARLAQAVHNLNELRQGISFVTPQSDVFDLLENIISIAVSAVDAENGALLLLDEETGELVYVEVQGPGREGLLGYHLPVGMGVSSWVAATQNPKLIGDLQQEPGYSAMMDEKLGLKTNSLVSVPLADGRRTLGVIEMINTRSGRAFKESDLEILLLLAYFATVGLVKAEGNRTGVV